MFGQLTFYGKVADGVEYNSAFPCAGWLAPCTNAVARAPLLKNALIKHLKSVLPKDSIVTAACHQMTSLFMVASARTNDPPYWKAQASKIQVCRK